jgi:hypothetical protein
MKTKQKIDLFRKFNAIACDWNQFVFNGPLHLYLSPKQAYLMGEALASTTLKANTLCHTILSNRYQQKSPACNQANRAGSEGEEVCSIRP